MAAATILSPWNRGYRCLRWVEGEERYERMLKRFYTKPALRTAKRLILDAASFSADLSDHNNIKVCMMMDADTQIPLRVDFFIGYMNEVQWARRIWIPPGSTAVFDRGIVDYGWFAELKERENVAFVTPLRKHARYTVLGRNENTGPATVKCDELIRMRNRLVTLRHIQGSRYGETYRLLSNDERTPGDALIDMYGKRERIEAVFQYMREYLKLRACGEKLTAQETVRVLWEGLEALLVVESTRKA